MWWISRIRDFFWIRKIIGDEECRSAVEQWMMVQLSIETLAMFGAYFILNAIWPKVICLETVFLALILLQVGWTISAWNTLMVRPTPSTLVAAGLGLYLFLYTPARQYIEHPPVAAVVVWLACFVVGLVMGRVWRKHWGPCAVSN